MKRIEFCDINAKMHMIISFIQLARPKQWIKNIFVFAALLFSGLVLDMDAVYQAIIAFISFCLGSSSIYFLNDYKDIAKDRLHPIKKNRPLASGALPRFVGIGGFVIFAVIASILSFNLLGIPSTVVLITYIAMNIAYSLGLKNVVILDVLMIATGFVLRILAGAAAISKMPSTWLILCAVTISLFLGFTKRRSEVVSLGKDAQSHRKVLAQYDVDFLNQMIAIVTGATLVCYILYTVDDHTVEMVGSRLLLLSVPFVLYGIFRYLYLAYHTEQGGDPTRAVFTDVPLLIAGSLWTVVCVSIIMWGGEIALFINRISQ